MNSSPPMRFHSVDRDLHLFNFTGEGGKLYQFRPDHDAIGKTGEPAYLCAEVPDFQSFTDPPANQTLDFDFFNLRGLPEPGARDDHCPIDAFFMWLESKHGRRP